MKVEKERELCSQPEERLSNGLLGIGQQCTLGRAHGQNDPPSTLLAPQEKPLGL